MNPTLPRVALVALCFLAPAARAAESPPATSAADLPRFKLERLFTLDRPSFAGHDPTGRFFFVEQTGKVIQYEDGKLAEKPYLDLSKKVLVDYECGVLSFAFHPKFAENGLLYVDYTAGTTKKFKSFISEFHADPKAKTVDLSTERVVYSADQPFVNHNGGQLQFGPDGYLYISFGDGGGQKDPLRNGQNPNTPMAKILRIDVTPREGFGVPKDNPFVGKEGYLPETWAWGFRNPWRFSFDKETGLLYAADVGQDKWEEIDVVEKGGNYGWSVREGMHDYQPGKEPVKTIDPIFEYPHGDSADPRRPAPASVTGGYVYRGKKIPELRGWYLFGDYSKGTFYGIKYENGKVTASGLLIDPAGKDPTRTGGTRPTQPASFGEDADGELYLLDANGPVYRIVPAAAGK